MLYQIVSTPWVRKAAPIALTAAATCGVIATAVLAAKATPDALGRKETAEKEKGAPLTTWEKIKAMTPSYLPAAGTGIITLGAIGGILIDSNRKQAELAGIIASGNQIINRISRKYGMLRNDVKEKAPEVIKEFDSRTFDDQYSEYVKNAREKRHAWCGTSAFPDVSGAEWGVPRMFGIEYGNGLEDENGHELIFFEATPGDIVTAFYNLNGLYHQDGYKYVNDLFSLLNIPKTDLGERLIWDPGVLFEEWETDWIGFHTEEWEMEDNVPQPATTTIIRYDIPPLAEGYAEYIGTQSMPFPEK